MTTVPVAVNGARSVPEIPSPLTRPNGHDARRALTTLQVLVEAREDLQQRLQALAEDVDAFWRASLECGDFNLVTCSVEASHAVHRAIGALDVDRYVIGGRSGGRRP